MKADIRIGCAGWSVASGRSDFFGEGGSVLERYATRFNAVEINSSFYKPHRHSTYQRWAACVPDDFRFSVKAPKAVTHTAKLRGCDELIDAFEAEIAGLGGKLGSVLVQLPPSLQFDRAVAADFFGAWQGRTEAATVCEPRHASWFTPEAGALLRSLGIGRVAADPAQSPRAAQPGGSPQTVYYRWHGAPRMYYSSYEPERLGALAERLLFTPAETWVIFDNTAAGAAVDNAAELMQLLSLCPAARAGVQSEWSD